MRVVFMGSADVSSVMLHRLAGVSGVQVAGVVTQPDRPAGRNRRLTPCPCKQTALEHGLSVITPEKINHEEALATLAAWAPDVVVVVAYGQFLGRRLLALPRLGCVNIHLSLLPRHRGAAPVQWAIASGDTVAGVTAMLMDEGMDSGDILGQMADPIRPEDTAGTLYDRLAGMGADLLVQTLDELQAGRAVRTLQDASQVTLAPKLKKEDGLIDWALPAEQIVRRVRGFNPWPACYTTLPERFRTAEHSRIKILQAEVCSVAAGASPIGGVITGRGEGPLIQTGEGALRLLRVQVEGGKPMSGQAFLCGHPLLTGDLFGR